MVDVSKVSQWVRKAVADIAAFDGKLRRIDTEAEKNALSALLAGNLSDDDKDYIEGFMIDRRGSSRRVEKIDGKRPEKNESRSVEVSLENEPVAGQDEEHVRQIKDMRNTARLFFDENGNVVKSEVKGKGGETTQLVDCEYVNDDERGLTIIQYMPDGDIIHTKGISYGTKEDGGFRLYDMFIENEGEVLYETHRTENGAIKRTSAKFRGGIPRPFIRNISEAEMSEMLSKVAVVEEVCEDGVATMKYLDADGNELFVQKGTYEIDETGFINTRYNTEYDAEVTRGMLIDPSERRNIPESDE